MEEMRKVEGMTVISYGTCRYCGALVPSGFSMCEACWDRFEEPRRNEWREGFAGSEEADDE